MLPDSKTVLAVILGGGAGTRLYPLTASRCKPAVSVAGKYRLVDIPISNCINSGISRMFVLTQFNSASLNRHVKNTYQFNVFSHGFVDILAAEQTPDHHGWFQGTADAVRQSLRHIVNIEFDYVLILSGDQLYQMDFSEMLSFHVKANAAITVATIPVKETEASDFGILQSDEDHCITAFIEKPSAAELQKWKSNTGPEMMVEGRKYLASMGIYIFSKHVLYDLLREVYPDATDFGKEIIPGSIGRYPIFSYQYEGYWTDIGNINSFFEANLALTEDIPEFNLFDNVHTIFTHPRMLPSAKIGGTLIEKTLIADGSIIGAKRISHSIIGIRSRIGKDTIIENSYIMGADYYETLDKIEQNKEKGVPAIGIGNGCFIRNTLIDKNCRIGNNVYVDGNKEMKNTDEVLYTVKDGIIVIKRGAVLPDGFRVA